VGVFILVGIFGYFYLIVAMGVYAGFPPFYKKGNIEEEIPRLAPFLFPLVAIFFFVILASIEASVFVPYLFLALGVISAWYGVRLRREVKERSNGPLPWLLTPLTIGILNRFPMLLFDAWTLGFIAFMGFTILF